jgi:polysaccharide export outer membrane protein
MRNLLITLVLALGTTTGACTDNPPAVYPTAVTLDEAKLQLGPGDKIDIVIFNGSKESRATYTLDGSGELSVQYIGTVNAGGKTTKEIKDEIQARLSDGYLVNPIVSLQVIEINSRKLSVFGQVAKSGSLKFTPGMTITEVIAQSGGFSPMARKNMVKVTRSIDGKKEIYKIPVEMIAEGQRPNFPVMPGDEVFVPERPW